MTLVWVSAMAGCALFTTGPKLAYIQIKGPGNITNELIFSLDDLKNKKDSDIRLSDHYAIELDLQWLWYEKEDVDHIKVEDSEGPVISLTPWFICKYRF